MKIPDQPSVFDNRKKCSYVEEFTVEINGRKSSMLKHECVLDVNHGSPHRCYSGRVIGEHEPELGDSLGRELSDWEEMERELDLGTYWLSHDFCSDTRTRLDNIT